MASKQVKGSGKSRADLRKERLAVALRENLHRRKAKLRGTAGSEQSGEQEPNKKA